MELYQYIIFAIVIVGVFTTYMALVHIFRSDRVRHRVKNAALAGMPSAEEEQPTVFYKFCESIIKLTGGSGNAEDQKELSTLLLQAGIHSTFAVTYFLTFRRVVQPVLLGIGAVIFLKVLVFSAGIDNLTRGMNLLLALIFLAAGLVGAKGFVTNRKQKRQQVLARSFPEMLDLLLICIESGLGLDAAFSRVCKELRNTNPIITSELERTRIELTMLADRSQALQNLADRTEIIPFKSLVAALIQTEKFGTSLVDTLRVLSDDQRTTRLLTAENRAARLPVLITIPVILCIFMPFFLVVIIGPPVVRIIEQGGLFGENKSK